MNMNMSGQVRKTPEWSVARMALTQDGHCFDDDYGDDCDVYGYDCYNYIDDDHDPEQSVAKMGIALNAIM